MAFELLHRLCAVVVLKDEMRCGEELRMETLKTHEIIDGQPHTRGRRQRPSACAAYGRLFADRLVVSHELRRPDLFRVWVFITGVRV